MSIWHYKRPKLYPLQEEALFNPSRFSIILGSTKSGKTVASLVWLFEQAIKEPKKTGAFWWLAPSYNQAKIAYRRLKAFLPEEIYRTNEAELTLTLSNGNMIQFKSAEKLDNLFGEDVHAIVLDEASRCRKEVWQLMRSVLTATEGPARLIGNVRGKNWFWRMWYSYYSAHQNTRDYRCYSLTIDDAVKAGVVSEKEHEDIRRSIPEAAYKELYLNIPQEDGSCPFSFTKTTNKLSDKTTKVYGVDLAKSQDWTVVVGLDEDGSITEFHRWQASWAETIERIKSIIKDTLTYMDSTGVGDPIVEFLQKEHQVRSFKFTSQSKQQLMENLALCLNQEKVIPLEGLMEEELRAYEFEYTQSGVKYNSLIHDDAVCGLALAAYALFHKQPVSLWDVLFDEPQEAPLFQ